MYVLDFFKKITAPDGRKCPALMALFQWSYFRISSTEFIACMSRFSSGVSHMSSTAMKVGGEALRGLGKGKALPLPNPLTIFVALSLVRGPKREPAHRLRNQKLKLPIILVVYWKTIK